MKKNILVLLSIVSLFIISCSDFVNPSIDENPASGESYCTVRGSLVPENLSGALPRSAFPANDVDLTFYTTNFYYKSSPTATERELCGTTTNYSFELKLPSPGTYYLEAESYLTSDTAKTVALKTTSPVELTLTEDNPSKNDVSLFLHIVVGEGAGNGSVELYFKYDSSINRVDLANSDGTLATNITAQVTGTFLQKWSSSNVTVGIHDYVFKFYSSANILLYQCDETVAVFPNKTTDTWVDNGNAEYFSTETIDGKEVLVMNITQTCLENFALTNFYVDSKVAASGNGSYFAPVKTLEDAVDKCTDDTKNYTINIKGTVDVNSGISVSKNITIQKAPDAISAKIQYSSTSNCLFQVSALKTLKISNIDIEGPGPDVPSSQSGGAAIYNRGTLILNNVNLSKFNNVSSTNQGGCLYNTGTGKIFITGGSITFCASNQGGAIYNNGKDIEIKDCTIDSCTAQTGGAIYNYSTEKITLSGTTSITSCTASSNGGGIYLGSGAKVYLQDNASITSCTAASGGGIYASAAMCRVYMKDSAHLDSTSDIRLNANGYVSLNGDLTPPAAANGIAATLTPQFYNVDDSGYPCTYSLLNEGDNTGLIAGNYSKFKVTSQASDPAVGWCITSKGKLTVKISTCSTKPSGMTEFTITDIADLNKIMGSAWEVATGETYTLTDNLTADDSTNIKDFAAVFDGAGYTISGLKKSFVKQLSGTIKNLTLEGESSTAGFATKVENTGKIEKCTNKVVVTYIGSDNVDIGGFTQSNAGTITGCINDAEITYSGSGNIYDVGGIAGRSSGTITNCVNTGSLEGNTGISMTTSMAGGIVGDGSNRNSIIRNCKNTGKITNFTCAGGIAGATKGNIENCYNRASTISVISSTDYASGICGGVDDDDYIPAIKNCYSTTAITSTEKKAAILGSSDGSIEYCYYLNDTGAVAHADHSDDDTTTTDTFVKNGNSCTLSEKMVNITGYGQSSDVLTLLKNWAASDSTKYSSWNTGNDGYPVFDWEKI